MEDIRNDAATTGDVLTYGMGQGLQRYSPLDGINAGNVKRLVPVWNYSLADNRGQESQPLVHEGVMYVTTHDTTHAIEAATGKRVWVNAIEYPPETPRIVCCGIVNRGAAIQDGMLYRVTLDAHVIAIDMKTGEEVWRSHAIDYSDGYSMTVAPLLADGVLITGISGAEYGIRGFIDGWGPERRARTCGGATPCPAPASRATRPGRATPGSTAAPRPGSPAATIPTSNLVYWGTGNGGAVERRVPQGRQPLYRLGAGAAAEDR